MAETVAFDVTFSTGIEIKDPGVEFVGTEFCGGGTRIYKARIYRANPEESAKAVKERIADAKIIAVSPVTAKKDRLGPALSNAADTAGTVVVGAAALAWDGIRWLGKNGKTALVAAQQRGEQVCSEAKKLAERKG